jgi:hypothetical protein
MLSIKNLDWENIKWEEFQKICLHLAQNIFRNCNFEEYLKGGNVQDGIDLLSIQQPGGKNIAIQCKKVQSLPESKAKKVIEAFVENYFVRQSSIFILATSTSIGEVAKKYLLKSAKQLKRDFDVDFWVWDRDYLEEQLRKEYTLVSSFFSPRIADEHCFAPSQLTTTKKIESYKPFIDRKIVPFHRVDNTAYKWWNISKDSISTLLNVITQDRLKAKYICLIADAYHGKTYLLRQTAHELQNLSAPFSPLLIDLKFQVIEPIVDVLNHNYGVWKNIPAKDIIVLLDGMDEVSSEKFFDMLLYIKAFTLSYPYITLVFSCRKLFYEIHKIEQVLSHFSTFELYPLSEADIKNYIKERLHNRAGDFERKVALNELGHFLYHPFYLVNLIDTYQASPRQLPNSKAGVVEQFVDKAFAAESHRRISGGKALREKRVLYRRVIQQLAFALQLAGRNTISEEDLQLLFPEEQRELLQHNSLITAHLEQWSFANALFQEHLAALALSKMNYQQIVSYISVGKKIKKVKTKWIQTVASLITLLQETNPIYKKILNFLEQDNIELLFTTEKTKFTEQQRLVILQKLLTRCTEKNIRPILIYESRIALFIDGDKKAVSYLVNLFNSKEQTSTIKVLICETLTDVSSLLGCEKKFYRKALLALNEEKDPYTAGKIVEVLSEFALGDETTATILVNLPISDHHEFRRAVYQYLIAKKYVDQFYWYGLKGMRPLINYNKGITRSGSEFWFIQFLLKTERSVHLKQLFAHLTDRNWLAYFDRHSIRKDEALKEVFKAAIDIFSKDPTIAIAVTNFLRELERHEYKHVHDLSSDFFDKTDSHSVAVRISVDEILTNNNWQFTSLIREGSIDYLLWEWEEGGYPIENLRFWIYGLSNYGKPAVAEQLQPLLNAATQQKLHEQIPSKYDDYQKVEQKKRENDIKYIQSIVGFKKGIQRFFKAYGKKEIPEEDILVDFEDRSIRKACDSNFIYRFLAVWTAKDKKAMLSRAFKILDAPDSFEYFRATEISDYTFHGTKDEPVLKNIAKDYFEKHIASLDFTNCIVQNGNRITWLRKQVLIGELFEKFEFDAPAPLLIKLVWLDQGGTRNFETSDLNKRKSITQKILSKLGEKDVAYFRQKVIDNLKLGISSASVLGNHIGLCRHLKIFEAKNILADILISKESDELSKVDVLDIYIELGGDLGNILPYFKKLKDFNSYAYFHAVSKFIEAFPKEVRTSLLKCLASVTVTQEKKVHAAQYLCALGDFTGFKFLAEELRLHLSAPYSIQSFSKMSALNSKDVLQEIKDLAYLLIDPTEEGDNFKASPRSVLNEWLQIIALKSEGDLYDVIQFYEDTYNAIKGIYANAKKIFWYEELVIEKFRDTDQTLLSFDKIGPVLKGLDV